MRTTGACGSSNSLDWRRSRSYGGYRPLQGLRHWLNARLCSLGSLRWEIQIPFIPSHLFWSMSLFYVDLWLSREYILFVAIRAVPIGSTHLYRELHTVVVGVLDGRAVLSIVRLLYCTYVSFQVGMEMVTYSRGTEEPWHGGQTQEDTLFIPRGNILKGNTPKSWGIIPRD